MDKYLISFDLVTSDSDNRQEAYDKVEEYLESLHYYAKPLKNVYLVAAKDTSCSNIRDYLESIFKKGDYILVVQLNGAWASYNSQKKLDEIRKVLSK